MSVCTAPKYQGHRFGFSVKLLPFFQHDCLSKKSIPGTELWMVDKVSLFVEVEWWLGLSVVVLETELAIAGLRFSAQRSY